MKLPVLKVTQRSTTGETVRRDIPRGCIGSDAIASQNENSSCFGDEYDAFSVEQPDSVDNAELFDPSLHKITQEAAVANWNAIRPAILRAAIESSAMHANQSCCLCTNEATLRCLQCSSTGYFCHQCFCDIHKKINLFHVGEVWEVCTGT